MATVPIGQPLPQFVGARIDRAADLARGLGLELRVIDLDADGWYTSDQRSDRVTVVVEAGTVREARVG